jgi:hypothetical protein
MGHVYCHTLQGTEVGTEFLFLLLLLLLSLLMLFFENNQVEVERKRGGQVNTEVKVESFIFTRVGRLQNRSIGVSRSRAESLTKSARPKQLLLFNMITNK